MLSLWSWPAFDLVQGQTPLNTPSPAGACDLTPSLLCNTHQHPTLQVDLVPLDCMGVPSNFHATLVGKTATPLLFMGSLYLLAAALALCGPSYQAAAARLRAVAFMVLFLVFPSASTAVFSAFQARACTAATRSSTHLPLPSVISPRISVPFAARPHLLESSPRA